MLAGAILLTSPAKTIQHLNRVLEASRISTLSASFDLSERFRGVIYTLDDDPICEHGFRTKVVRDPWPYIHVGRRNLRLAYLLFRTFHEHPGLEAGSQAHFDKNLMRMV